MIALVAKLPIKEGKVDEFIEIFKGLMAHVAEEDGTLMYTLNRDQADPNTLIVMERYRDKAALDAHSSTPHFKEFFKKSGEFIAGRPEMIMMDEVAAI